MELAFNAGPKKVEEYFQVAHENNFTRLELNGASPLNYPQTFDQKRISEVLRLRDKYQMKYGFHSASYANSAEIIPTIRKGVADHLVEYVEIAKALESEYLILHFGYWHNLFRDEVFRCLIENLTPAVELASKYGMPIGIENMNKLHEDCEIMYLGVTVEELSTVFDVIDTEYLGVTLDVAHACLLDGGCKPFIEAFPNKLVSVQLSDNDLVLDRHLAVGEGKIDFKVVLSQLQDAGFNGAVCLELPSVEARLISQKKLLPVMKELGLI